MNMTTKRCLSVGEAMLRFRVPTGERLQDLHRLEVDVGGAELNAMIAAAVTGLETRFVTKLPEGPLGDRVVRHARQHGVEVLGPRESGGRLGTYYVEAAPTPRGTEVVYDRAESSFSHLRPQELRLDELLSDVDHVHVTGITFALGDAPAEAARKLLAEARDRGITVSYDINYRVKLWSLASAREATHRLMEYVTTLFASPHDLEAFFSAVGDTAAASKEVRDRFRLDHVVVSEREDRGQGWTRCRVTLVADEVRRSDWVVAQVVDPLGAGDALAGVALGELLRGSTLEEVASHAAAAAALKQTLMGDALVADPSELSLPGLRRGVRR